MNKFEESGDFHFKYVAEEELLRIVRKVRREKQKEKDALLWQQYLEVKQEKVARGTREDTIEERKSATPSCHHCNELCDGGTNFTKKARSRSNSEQDNHSAEADVLLPIKQSLPTESVVTTRETGSTQRIALLRHRIGLALDSITGMIQCRPAEPDGPDDFERRKTRINEFLSRFSRNYLFQFQRQVAELRRQMVCASPETPGRHTEYQALMQKLVSAHQTAVQSLQAYLSQIPASLQVTNIFGKLQDLLHHLCDLSSLKNQLDVHGGIIDGCEDVDDTDEIFLKCKELLALLEDKRLEVEEMSLSARASSPPSARGCMNPRSHRVINRAHAGVRQTSWKKSTAHLARAKFGVPSSVRSSMSPCLSSRECQSNEEKPLKGISTNDCCNLELKDLISHMHDVICNKLETKKKKKSKERCKTLHDNNASCNRRSVNHHKPLTEVQNLSKNVQLVITRHCDSERIGFVDAATDTADLHNVEKCQHSEEQNKKSKKVGWASAGAPPSKDFVVTQTCDQNTTSTFCQHLDVLSDQGDAVSKVRKPSEDRLFNYQKRFQDYNSKLENPVIQRWCEDILDGVFQEISEELEPSFLLEKMYHLEFKDA